MTTCQIPIPMPKPKHGALCRRQCARSPRRHDESRDRRAWGVNQPRKNSDKDDTQHIVGDYDRAGIEEMLVVKVDSVEPRDDAGEAANQRAHGGQFRLAQRRGRCRLAKPVHRASVKP